jgi:hypothetical protein
LNLSSIRDLLFSASSSSSTFFIPFSPCFLFLFYRIKQISESLKLAHHCYSTCVSLNIRFLEIYKLTVFVAKFSILRPTPFSQHSVSGTYSSNNHASEELSRGHFNRKENITLLVMFVLFKNIPIIRHFINLNDI